MDHWKFYNKEKVIGKGSFGLAYLVKSTVNNRHYVIKSIELPSNSSNEVHNAILILSVDQDVVLRFARISFLFPRNLSKPLFNVLSYTLINVSCICSSDTVFPHIVAAATILFWIHKSLKISYSFLIKFSLM